MSGEVQRVSGCPYRVRKDQPSPWAWGPSFWCQLTDGFCDLHGNAKLTDCWIYHRHMSRAIHMPERRGPY